MVVVKRYRGRFNFGRRRVQSEVSNCRLQSRDRLRPLHPHLYRAADSGVHGDYFHRRSRGRVGLQGLPAPVFRDCRVSLPSGISVQVQH